MARQTASIPFNGIDLTGDELTYIAEACREKLFGDGRFTRYCHEWIEQQTGTARALLTHSCTAALEMAAMLLDVRPGDEIIMPSYTFVSTANAFVLRGGVPVFVDIRPDTLNIDETLIEAAITPRTMAIVPVHYAGTPCEMDKIAGIADRSGLAIVEDAAQAVGSTYRGKALGAIGTLGAYSFHETKNIISGEGGALLVNDPGLAARAEIIREKGTNRSSFVRGEVDKYSWHDIGSSYLPSEIVAAFLWAQLQQAEHINQQRLARWRRYHEALEPFEKAGRLTRPQVPADCTHNGHIYHVVFQDPADRERVTERLAAAGVQTALHYVPLHSSPAGLKFGRPAGDLPVTDWVWRRMLRLPMSNALTEDMLDRVIDEFAKI